MAASFGPQEFQDQIGASDDQMAKLECYVEVLKKWQAKINLVGPKTLPDVWQRHMLDSAQLIKYLPTRDMTLADIGTGAGLPGLVLAILGVRDVHLVDSDQRKMAFVREAARLTETPVTVHACRIDALTKTRFADFVTSRALAPVTKLLDWAAPILKETGQCLFLKGQHLEDELREVHNIWKMDSHQFPSLSDPAGRIIRIERMEPYHG